MGGILAISSANVAYLTRPLNRNDCQNKSA